MSEKDVQELERVTICFAGDSGDGMQLTGSQFTNTTAGIGNDLNTLPDYPAEIRAPIGTTFGVSGFQIQFSSSNVHTPGDSPDVLVAMNPAALKVNLKQLVNNGIIIINTDSFQSRNLTLAGYASNPLEDGSLDGHQVFPVNITGLTREALNDVDLSLKEKDRCKNFFALGMTYWMYSRPLETTETWIGQKFKGKDALIEANTKALKAGYSYALSTEIFTTSYKVPKAEKQAGHYRNITGNQGIAFGLITAAKKAERELFLGSYPITPASDILHELAKHRNFGVKTFQAEDEIAGIGAALGAVYAGALGVTTTSGPGIALKSEFMGLAMMTELPLVIINIQRGGPSTGLPTKTEQSDLLQALYGRNGESPIPVIAAAGPADCFNAAFEAARIALQFTTPVILLSDGYIANGTEPWLIPDPGTIPDIVIKQPRTDEEYLPYKRDPERLSRLHALPGTPGLEHRIGGLEKQDVTGNISYDSDNHDKMVRIRADKVGRINRFVDDPELIGKDHGDLLILSWGSTYGPILAAVEKVQKQGREVSWCHLRWINPLPSNLSRFINNFKTVLIPEINLGQLSKVIRAEYLVDARGFNKVRGLPLKTSELLEEIDSILKGLN
ncbi:MAG: 2-oxoacid:acceptor oxidoreductase subunit alpha [Calditrichaeota bacterium]|nr:MAG: 2-oxoacid:acceptor oxidoreductase subunit alpha [Calditrichota bacterium]